MTAVKRSNMLRNYGIHSGTIRFKELGGVPKKGYHRKDFV